ncbi:BRO-N domain-containing protein [Candidatus Avelusimicrobium fimicolum]|jgi:DNA-damage-inducible protein D|uniref:BRO-N domain-containing protein n=1 Tax=Candidatus Avelusimicrobium fimicolum TaxID=3416216 RepID=UPI003D095AF8
MTKSALAIFEDFKIRRHYDEKTETWYFSIVDVVYALTESKDPRNYWKVLKHRLLKEGNQSVTNCNQLKLQAADGKFYKTDVATPEQLLRLIQSIPSPKAEPFKLWLAKVGYERIQETADPSKALDRARTHWKAQGRSQKWIQQRMMGQETRNKLTDYWQAHGVTKSDDFAMLTNVIHQEWSDLSVAQHKKLKGLEHENLREHMSEAELLFTALAELATRQIAEKDKSEGIQENKAAGHKGGKLAKQTRLQFEEATGTKVVTSKSSLPDFTPKKRIKKRTN